MMPSFFSMFAHRLHVSVSVTLWLALSSLPAWGLANDEAGSEAPAETIETPKQEVPLPEPVQTLPDNGSAGPPRDVARPNLENGGAVPPVQYDLEQLPEPVRRMHRLIVTACLSGDPEALRSLIGTGETATQLSLGGLEGDPIKFLREISGDEEGHEILAILLEMLRAGYVHLDAGTAEEMYVWPYFFALPLDSLDKRQRVELFTLVTAGDYEDMKSFGAYIFYRVGIKPDGRWAFFVAGD